MEKTKRIFKGLIYIAVTILAIDFFFFCMWVASGQHPTDGVYMGVITTHILRFIL